MSTSLTYSFVTFFHSLASIGISLFHSVLAVLQAVVALFQQLFQNILQLVQAFVQLGFNIFRGVFGFIAANFLVIALIGGIYYWYTKSKTGKGVVNTVKNTVTGKK